MAMLLAGRPAKETAIPLESALAFTVEQTENWDTRAALLWCLVTAERFRTVETALEPMIGEVQRSGSARGFVAAYSTLVLLKLRLGALPEADAAARVALQVVRESDLGAGLRSPLPFWSMLQSRRASLVRQRRCSPCCLNGAGRRVSALF
jgi:hypothetical protein